MTTATAPAKKKSAAREPAKKLLTTSPEAPAEAREQAEAYNSIFAPIKMDLNENGTDFVMLPPHPEFGLLDDDQTARYEQLMFDRDELYDRDPDVIVPEQRLRDPKTGHETGVVIPGETLRGNIRTPFRTRDAAGKATLVSPPFSVQTVVAVLGQETYQRIKDAGKSSLDVWKLWGEQSYKVRERQAADSKSDGGTVDVEAVPETDSERPVEVPSSEDS